MSDFDNETYFDNESEYDSYEDIIYDSDEPNSKRFCIALCELYNNKIHGPGPLGHYYVNCRYKSLYMDWIYETADFIHIEYQLLNSYDHDLFPNYREIVLREDYIKPEIVECININHCCVAIIKTFWIKIIQRAWRNVLKKREAALKCRQTLSAIRYKEINGLWSTNCYAVGRLQGLLSNIL